MTVYDVVMKLVGPIDPLGDSNADAKRLENLKELTALVENLRYRVSQVVPAASRQEASMKAIGMHAKTFLQQLRET